MAKRRSYPLEFRQQLVELVRAGRTPEELAKEFEPSAGGAPHFLDYLDIPAL